MKMSVLFLVLSGLKLCRILHTWYKKKILQISSNHSGRPSCFYVWLCRIVICGTKKTTQDARPQRSGRPSWLRRSLHMWYKKLRTTPPQDGGPRIHGDGSWLQKCLKTNVLPVRPIILMQSDSRTRHHYRGPRLTTLTRAICLCARLLGENISCFRL